MHFWCRPMQNLLALRRINSLFHDFPISGPQEYWKKTYICACVCVRARVCWKIEDDELGARPSTSFGKDFLRPATQHKVQSTILFYLPKRLLNAL